MFFPSPKDTTNVFNPSEFACNDCCSSGSGSSSSVVVPTTPTVAFNATNTVQTGPFNGNYTLNIVPFNTITSSSGGGFSTSTGTFTVPTAGYYQFNGTVALTNFTTTAGFWVNLGLYKNGALILVNSGPFLGSVSGFGSAFTLNVSDAVLCAAGDTLYLATYAGNTGTWTLSATFSTFSGFLTANGQVGATGATGPQGPTTPTVAFSVVWNGAAFPIYSAGAPILVAFDTKPIDTTSRFNATAATVGGIPAYSFLPLVAGYYQISTVVSFFNFSGVCALSLQLYKNGVGYKRGVQNQGFTGNSIAQTANMSALVYLNGTTDYIQIFANSIVVGTTLDSGNNYFDGIFISS
jgi:hypothetical protein